jgi:thiol-disulfide isomerase/thioredoxin
MIKRILPTLAIVLSCAMPSLSRAANAPTTAPSTQPAEKRSTQAIMADVQAASKEMSGAISGPKDIVDAKKRAEAAPKVLPTLNKMLALTDELAASDDPQAKQIGTMLHGQLLPMLATFGDEKVIAQLEKQSSSDDAKQALQAKLALLQSKWWKASDNADAQTKMIDDATALAKANPESMDVARTLMTMSSVGAANKDLEEKLQTVLTDNMKGEFVDSMKEQVAAQKKMREVEGKPLTISGKTVDGEEFSTDKWKGKVVFVDFWATWCGPCLAELPRVKKVYADYHEKGLEILGVSNDYEADALKKFVAKDPKMPWPQLFDANAASKHQWNPITTGFGIHGIPTMFLIDKKGVCRSVSAREDFEEMIPKLLAE